MTPYLIGCIFKARGACMTRTFIQTHEFSRNWDNLSKEERNEIKKVIEALKKSLGGE